MVESSLRKFQPTPQTPWNYTRAAHLLNRAGFGGRPEEIDRLARLGPEGAVDDLINYDRVPDDSTSVDFSELRRLYEDAVRLRQAGADEAARRALNQRINRALREKFQETREWWVARMVQTRRPLQEK